METQCSQEEREKERKKEGQKIKLTLPDTPMLEFLSLPQFKIILFLHLLTYFTRRWKWKLLSCVWLFATWWTIQSTEFLVQNAGVGSLSLLKGLFPTQEWNPGPLHCSQILYQLSHKGSPRILEWVVYPFSSWSSWTRNQTSVSCIAGGFCTKPNCHGSPKQHPEFYCISVF